MAPEDKLRANFAANLARLREGRRLSQAALVAALNESGDLGLTRTALANYESGKAFPKILTLHTIARYFGTTIDTLIAEHESSSDQYLPSPAVMSRRGGPDVPGVPDTDLLKEYIDLLEIRKFNVVFHRDLLRKLKEKAGQLNDAETITHLFSKTYLANLISNSKDFEDRLQALLEPDEYAVFHAIQKGEPVQLLAEAQQTSEDDIIRLFISARKKVLATIEEIQK